MAIEDEEGRVPAEDSATGSALVSGNNPDGYAGYDVVKAAPSWAAVIGLVSGFALTAVVLVITTAASSPKLSSAQEVELGFATTLFALGFLGCLLCAFSLASVSGERNSPAILSASMLVAGATGVCLIAVLGGFESLSAAFLPDSKSVFFIICVAAAVVAPPFMWFPHWDIVRNFSGPSYAGPPADEDAARKLVLQLCYAGGIGAAVGTIIWATGLFGEPRHWEYLVITFAGLTYSAAMVLGALLMSTATVRGRLSVRQTWVIAAVQILVVTMIIALLP